MKDAFLLSCILAQVLIIWFQTNAFIEWVKLLRVGKFFKSDEYDKYSEEELDPVTYPYFLLLKQNSFFNKIISCPYCLNVYLCLLMFGPLSQYISWWYFSVTYIVSICIYFVVKRLEK